MSANDGVTERSRLLRGVRAMLAADAVRLVFRTAVIVLLSRYLLTPSSYGLLFLAMSILGVSFLFSVFGLPKATARYVTEYVETSPDQVTHVVRFGLTTVLASVTVVCVALVALRGQIAGVFGEPELAPLLLVGAGFLAARSVEKYLHAVFQAFNAVQYSGLVKSVDSVAQVAFILAFVLLGFGTVGAMAGFVVAAVIGAVVGLVVLVRGYYREHDPAPEMEDGLKSRILRYSVPLTAGSAANALDQRVDIILVGYLLNPAAAGYYTLAKQISESVSTPATSLGFTVSPQLGTYKASDDLSLAGDLYETAFVHVVAVYVPAAAGMILVARPAIAAVFGDAYLGAVPAVQVFGVYTLLLALDQITNDGLDYLGRARVRAVTKGVTSVANVALNLALIPVYGVVGATVATVLTYSVLVAVELYVVSSVLPLPVRGLARTVGVVFAITVGMSAVVVALLPYVSGLPSLLGVVGVAVGLWALLTGASGLLDFDRVWRVIA
ncbi:flippase [Halobacterium zhouii]|uniref:flippase n=1 Tax=Halobacterium zhouii TaxID=2902624 RepID=UPI001E355578|nr:flippase [Halobacterium zhouii]